MKKLAQELYLSDRFEKALLFATRLHAGQLRKGTATPYVAHLMAVASLVLENGGDEDQAIAALLHDAIEDQGHSVTLDGIRARFGETVAAIVEGCTDARTTPKPPWQQRKEAYLAHLAMAPDSERLVAVADKLHNARTILADYRAVGEAVWDRFNGGKAGTLWYYRALVERFQAAGPALLVQELDRVVSEIERLATTGNCALCANIVGHHHCL
jgi:(p)ppGpp synthase/HD superfamily hydrolase